MDDIKQPAIAAKKIGWNYAALVRNMTGLAWSL